MLDKTTALQTIPRKCAKLPIGHAIDLRTFKRDRSVIISRTDEDEFDIMQNGFEQNRYTSTLKGLKKILKTLLKKEFPRSNKIRCYDLGESGTDVDVRRKNL